MNIDFRKRTLFSCIQCYKYFGTVIDSKFNFKAKRDAVCRKPQRCCSRSLSRFHVDLIILHPFDLFLWCLDIYLKKLSQSADW